MPPPLPGKMVSSTWAIDFEADKDEEEDEDDADDDEEDNEDDVLHLVAHNRAAAEAVEAELGVSRALVPRHHISTSACSLRSGEWYLVEYSTFGTSAGIEMLLIWTQARKIWAALKNNRVLVRRWKENLGKERDEKPSGPWGLSCTSSHTKTSQVGQHTNKYNNEAKCNFGVGPFEDIEDDKGPPLIYLGPLDECSIFNWGLVEELTIGTIGNIWWWKKIGLVQDIEDDGGNHYIELRSSARARSRFDTGHT